MDLGEEPVLELDRGDVVEHGQTHGTGEPVGRQAGVGRIGADHLDVGPGEPLAQRGGEVTVDLDRGQGLRPVPEDVGGETGTGTDLQHVLAELHPIQDPRDDPPLDGAGPFGARTQLEMASIHTPCLAAGVRPVDRPGGVSGPSRVGVHRVRRVRGVRERGERSVAVPDRAGATQRSLKASGFDVPLSVMTTTGSVDLPLCRDGILTVQVVGSGQRTDAVRPPTVALMRPDGLRRPEPRTSTD